MYAEMPDLAKPFVASLPGASGPNAQRVTALTFAFLHRVAQLVLDAQGRGEVAKDVDPLVAAQNAFAAYFLALLNWISGFATPDTMVDPVLKNALALQIRGLAPR
jgi:TetR/AcrR family transcriptional regulator, cholesterol catabolism regulator